jgi:hypothetical protein
MIEPSPLDIHCKSLLVLHCKCIHNDGGNGYNMHFPK